MATELCYYIRCDFPGCRNWNGAVRPHPDPDPSLEAGMLRRMGWSRDPDLCPEHRGQLEEVA